MTWKDITVAIAIVAATIGAISYFTPMNDFLTACEETKEQFEQTQDKIEFLAAFSKAEFVDIRISTKRDMLYQMYKQYGTRDCIRMPQPAQTDCLNLEREIKELEEKKKGLK